MRKVSVDSSVYRYLEDKTVVLVTHQLQFIKAVDQIVVMDKGKIHAAGAFQDLNVGIYLA